MIGGHSITTWTGGGGEGVSQMSMIVHAREGGGLGNVHVDKSLGKCALLHLNENFYSLVACDMRHALRVTVLCKIY